MSVRLTLLALSSLVLTACDGNPLQAVTRQSVCCCDRCPTTAAPASPAVAPVRTARGPAPRQRPARDARTWRVRTEPVVARETRHYGYQDLDESVSGYGGRYGARGGVSAGVRVSVQESETSSERYSYRDSASGYAYGSASGGYAGGGMAVTGAPQQPYVRYKSASTTPGGWLEWPGKVED